MKPGAVIAIVIGVIAVIYFAASRGLIGSGAVVGPGGVLAPQPSSNYSGYLAATTAPQVSGILNTVLSGVNSGLHSWLAPATPSSPAPQQGPSASSPSLAAQPSSYVAPTSLIGPAPAQVSSGGLQDQSLFMATPVGPVASPSLAYNATPGSAFDFSGLSGQNAWDPAVSLEGNYATAGA